MGANGPMFFCVYQVTIIFPVVMYVSIAVSMYVDRQSAGGITSVVFCAELGAVGANGPMFFCVYQQ